MGGLAVTHLVCTVDLVIHTDYTVVTLVMDTMAKSNFVSKNYNHPNDSQSLSKVFAIDQSQDYTIRFIQYILIKITILLIIQYVSNATVFNVNERKKAD